MLPLQRQTIVSSVNFARRAGCRGAIHHRELLRSQSTLVVAELTKDGSALAPSTLSAITAASKLHSGPISIITFSSDNVGVPSSVSSVIHANAGGSSSLLAETVTNAVVAANEKHKFSHIVAASTKFGANYLGRAGAQLGASPISDVVEILSEGKSDSLIVRYEIFNCRSKHGLTDLTFCYRCKRHICSPPVRW